MKQTIFEITKNIPLNSQVMLMDLKGDVKDNHPGQFIDIALDGLFLRRPISICNISGDTMTIIYKIVGKGTEKMAMLKAGDKLDVLTNLGNGYDLSIVNKDALLIGGGVGVPPLFMLAKELLSKGINVTIILGFNTKDEIFYEDEFKALGAKVLVTTVDGSYGIKGLVTDAFKDVKYDYFYTCGPLPMLKAVYKATDTSGEFSFEERMGCGFGACMGCSCKTNFGNKRICKDGPVFKKEEIIWEN